VDGDGKLTDSVSLLTNFGDQIKLRGGTERMPDARRRPINPTSRSEIYPHTSFTQWLSANRRYQNLKARKQYNVLLTTNRACLIWYHSASTKIHIKVVLSLPNITINTMYCAMQTQNSTPAGSSVRTFLTAFVRKTDSWK